MKLIDLLEAKEQNLLGLTVDYKLITDKTHLEDWDDKFECDGFNLTSLEHCPRSTSGRFYCDHNKLTSLEHCPQVVGGYFSCEDNQLTSLKDVHKHVKQMNGTFYASANPIKSHVLGLLLIKGCITVVLNNQKVQEILRKYLPNTRGHAAVAECQNELIEADLDDFAQL